MDTGTWASSRRESRSTLTALKHAEYRLPWDRDTPPAQRPHAIPVAWIGSDVDGNLDRSFCAGKGIKGAFWANYLSEIYVRTGGWRGGDRGESARDSDRDAARRRIACRGDRKSAAEGFGRESPTLSRRSPRTATGLSVARRDGRKQTSSARLFLPRTPVGAARSLPGIPRRLA